LPTIKAFNINGDLITKDQTKVKVGLYQRNPNISYIYTKDTVIPVSPDKIKDTVSQNYSAVIFKKIQVPDYLKKVTIKNQQKRNKFLLMKTSYLSGKATRVITDDMIKKINEKFKKINLELQQRKSSMWGGLELYGGGNLFNEIEKIFSGIGHGIESVTDGIFHGAEGLIKQRGNTLNKLTKTVFHGVKSVVKARGNAIGGILQKLKMPLIIGGAIIAGIIMIIIIVKIIITKKTTNTIRSAEHVMVIWENPTTHQKTRT